MRYRGEALLVSALLLVGGILVIILAVTVDTSQFRVPPTLLAFTGLGLLLIGSLILFATPDNIVSVQVTNRALDPYVNNLQRIAESYGSNLVPLHFPSPVLGADIPVLLVLDGGKRSSATLSQVLTENPGVVWKYTLKVLEPVGLGLLSAYERMARRDFLGVDLEELSRLLTRALVSDLQLAGGFSLRIASPAIIEVEWRNCVITHTCIDEAPRSLPEFCCLCSSVACAIAKATGKPVRIESPRNDGESATVTSTYRLGDSYA